MKNYLKRFLSGWCAALLLATGFSVPTMARADTITYYHNDFLGSPVVATNSAGAVLWRQTYKPYGERMANEEASFGNKIRYTSRHEDDDTGLVYMGARYYDPVTARFIAVDPMRFDEKSVHSVNRYAYANNNPYRYIDPDGRTALHAARFTFTLSYEAATWWGAGVAGSAFLLGAWDTVDRLRGANEWMSRPILSEQGDEKGAKSEDEVTPLPDHPPQSGGRSGQRAKDATGPPNSAIPTTGGSVWITDGNGNVVVDVTPERAKPVTPGVGFGDKRPPTDGELDLWRLVKGPRKP